MIFVNESLEGIVTREMTPEEAEEARSAIMVYPRRPQILYSMDREDQILGQYYNLIQILFDIRVNPTIGLALDFYVIEVNIKSPILYEDAKTMITQRLINMKIPLGTNIIDPMAVLCLSTKRGG